MWSFLLGLVVGYYATLWSEETIQDTIKEEYIIIDGED